MFEDREDVVAAGGRLVTAGIPHRRAHQAADIGEQGGVAIVKAPEQLGRALDIGQQERDVALRQLALRLQLGADEADGHDAVLLGRPQQPAARPVPRGLVLEHHLAEPREGIADVRRVVDRQTTSATRIDVGKGAVGKLRALLRAQRWHALHDRKNPPGTGERRAPTAAIPARRTRLSGLAPANAHPGQHQQRHDDDDGNDDRPHRVSLDHHGVPKAAGQRIDERARSRGGPVASDLGGAVKARMNRPRSRPAATERSRAYSSRGVTRNSETSSPERVSG